MSPVAIPAWTSEGVLPPVNSSDQISPERSPYAVSLTDYVLRFSDTSERRVILGGFLQYRAALHSAGLEQGFQWLNGSFLEHVEVTERRAPNDVDVVTFFRLPPGVSQTQILQRAPRLVDHAATKAAFHVDGYLVHLGMDPERLARQCAYWYSLWSHRRNLLWKGFVQVDLAPAEDSLAAATLASITAAGGRP